MSERLADPGSDGARRIGLWSAVALVIANMIGAGVFTTSGFSLADLGSPTIVLVAWAVGGVLAMCGALCYGALARRFPESGGEYLFLSKTVHPLAGFLAGWVSLLAGFTGPIAVAALALQSYATAIVDLPWRPEWTGTLGILVAACMHGLRLREGLWLQNAAVSLKVAAILAFTVLGAAELASGTDRAATAAEAAAASTPFDLGTFAVTLVWISFAYSGWNAAVYIGGEVRDPDRNLARSLFLGTLGVTFLYLGLNAVFVFAGPIESLAGRPDIGAAASEQLGGAKWATALSSVVVLALFTSISAMMMAGPRVYARMAEDGVLPAFFATAREAPTAAIALQAALAIAAIWTSELIELLGTLGFTLALSAAATVAALLWLRRKEGAERVPIPGYPITPIVYLVTTLAVSGFMIARAPGQAAAGLGVAVTGVVVYWAMRFVSGRSSA